MTVTRERCVIAKFRKSTFRLQISCSFIKKSQKNVGLFFEDFQKEEIFNFDFFEKKI